MKDPFHCSHYLFIFALFIGREIPENGRQFCASRPRLRSLETLLRRDRRHRIGLDLICIQLCCMHIGQGFQLCLYSSYGFPEPVI